MGIISKKTRVELVSAVVERYQASSKADKTRILDEFVRLTGYHRKHAIRVLLGRARAEKPRARARPRLYDEAVLQALVVLWEASDRICGKRLRPLLPLLVSSLERHGHLQLDEVVRKKLLRASASTIDRLLAPARSGGARKRRNKPPAVRSQIPVRTFADWGDPLPGFMEMDLVAHCGGSMSGRYNHTLVLTDIASGWTECIALAVRDSNRKRLRKGVLDFAIDRRSPRIPREPLFPQSRCQRSDVAHRMIFNPLQHIDEVRVRIHVV